MIREGETHYSPISWADAFELIGEHVRASTPDRCVFYTSGRTANETAFMYPLFARALGTNNLPDCSNMCHESSGSALNPTIGIGKGTVSLDDIHDSELIFVVGQNPGTNHAGMLSALKECKDKGGKVVAVNPLPEAGLFNFKDPQTVSGVVGGGTPLADEYLQIKVGGDLALFQALAHLLLAEEERNPGTVVDRSFIDAQTDGFDAYRDARKELDWDETEKATGLARTQIEDVAGMLIRSKATHLLLGPGRDAAAALGGHHQGNGQRPAPAGQLRQARRRRLPGPRALQRPGRPDHGHLGKAQGMAPGGPRHRVRHTSPRGHGVDAVEAMEAFERDEVDVFVSMGGNFSLACSDTETLEAGMQRIGLTVHVSTKPNRSHIVHGRTSLILPTAGRTDKDDKHPGGAQFLSVEDSMSVVHSTQGRLQPVSEHLLAEPVIIARMADATFGEDHPVNWKSMAVDYDVVRDHISRVIPGFQDFNDPVRTRNGFVLPTRQGTPVPSKRTSAAAASPSARWNT